MSLYVDQESPRYEAAEAFLTPVVEEQRRKLGDDHLASVTSMSMLSDIYSSMKPPKYAEAEAFLKKALEDQCRKFGNQNRTAVNSATQLAGLYFKQKKYTEAEVLLAPIVTDTAVKKLLKADNRAIEVTLMPSEQRLNVQENGIMLAGIDLLSKVYDKLGKSQQASPS
jgi:hypothetical protein